MRKENLISCPLVLAEPEQALRTETEQAVMKYNNEA